MRRDVPAIPVPVAKVYKVYTPTRVQVRARVRELLVSGDEGKMRRLHPEGSITNGLL